MAISFEGGNIGDSYWSAYVPQPITVSSDNVTAGMRYVFDIYDFDGNQVYRAKVLPDINGLGVFDPAPIVRTLIQPYWQGMGSTNDVVNWNFDPRTQITIHVGEDISGTLTPDLYISDTTYYWNGYPNIFDSVNTNVQRIDSVPTFDTANVFSSRARIKEGIDTIAPRINFYTTNKHTLFVPVYPSIYGVNNMYIQKLDKYGNYLSDIFSKTYEFFDGLVYEMLLDPIHINNDAGYSFIDSNTEGYEVSINLIIGGYIQFRVFTQCPSDRSVMLTFLNRYGGYESMLFNAINRQTSTFDRKTFGKNIYQFNNPDGYYEYYDNYGTLNEATINNFISHTNSVKLMTQYTTEDIHYLTKEILASPQVFIQFAGGDLKPCYIKSGDWTEKVGSADKLMNFEVEVVLGQQIISQTR